MTPNDAVHEDRAHALRRTALGVLVALSWIIVVGVFWRQAGSSADNGVLTSIGSGEAPHPSSIVIEAGTDAVSLGTLFEEFGVAEAATVPSLLASPEALRLPAELEAVTDLTGFLAPGEYDITPTTDARSLVERMAAAFITQLDDDIRAGIVDRDLDLTALVHVAAASADAAETRSELPLIAGALWNLGDVGPSAAAVVGYDALAAAVFPATTDASSFGRDDQGDLRLGVGLGTGGPGGGPLGDLVSRALQITDGRSGIIVLDASGDTALASHHHRYVETASVYKLAVLAVVVDEVQQGRLELDASLQSQLVVPDGALLSDMTIRDALDRMITISDNATAEALLAGLGPDTVNQRLRSWGVVEFSVGSKPQVATAYGVGRLLEQIARGEQFDENSRRLMLDLLYQTDQSSRLAAGVDAPVAHKTGDLDTVVNDAGIISSARGELIVVALIEDVDVRASADQAISRIGSLVDNWFGYYLDAEQAVAEGRLNGCVFAPSRTTEGPLTGARVALDAGHGGEEDRGARAELPDGDTLDEADVVLVEAELIADQLVEAGATVFLTRCEDRFLSTTERSALINAWGPDLAISLHIDGSESSAVDASSVLYLDDRDADLAEAILGTDEQPGLWDALNRDMPISNGGIIRGSIGLLPFTEAPTVLTEPVVLTHPAESEALSADGIRGSERLRIIAEGHAQGIIGYLQASR